MNLFENLQLMKEAQDKTINSTYDNNGIITELKTGYGPHMEFRYEIYQDGTLIFHTTNKEAAKDKFKEISKRVPKDYKKVNGKYKKFSDNGELVDFWNKEESINKNKTLIKTEGVMDIVQNIKNYFKNKSNDKKAQAILQKIADKGGDIDSFFKELVPSSGKADTKAGELIRAMMRILYRDYNDGDNFNEGYGLETCGPAAAYLIKNGFTDFEEYAEEKNDEGIFSDENDEEYTSFLNSVAEKVIKHIENNPQLLIEPNDEDMLETDITKLKELEPTTDFDIYPPYEVEEHIDAGNIDYKDVLWEVQSWDYCEDAELHFGHVITIPNVNKEIYDELSRRLDKNMDYYIEELNNEYGDPNEEDYEDEDYDEDEDY